jgi:hypothetical protein
MLWEDIGFRLYRYCCGETVAADCPINVVERLWLRTVPLMLRRDYGGGLSN